MAISVRMKSIRNAIGVLLFGLGVVMAVTQPVSAAAILQVNASTGVLTGAQNVNVDGLLFDVRFVDGRCTNVFGSCSSSADFLFKTSHDAVDASYALLEQVFSVPIYNEVPDLTAGCSDTHNAVLKCNIVTPFSIGFRANYVDASGHLLPVVESQLMVNYAVGGAFDAVGSVNGGIDVSASLFGVPWVWAVWSGPHAPTFPDDQLPFGDLPSRFTADFYASLPAAYPSDVVFTTAEIPEPPTIILVVAALVGFLCLRRRKVHLANAAQ